MGKGIVLLSRNSIFMKQVIASLLLSIGCLTASAQLSKHQQQKIDSLLTALGEAKQFNGNVLVAQHGKPVFSKSYGYADFEWKIPNDKDTKFRIGSITKQFTAMLIMQLKQQGKLSLDSAVTSYLPWYRHDTGDSITVRQLLMHTSGLKNYTERRDFYTVLAYLTQDQRSIAQQYCQEDLEFRPGTRFKYCNTDYYLLGLIIEAVSGKPYAQALQEMIFDKAGMSNTGIDVIATLLPKRAKGYEYGFYGYENARLINMETSIYAAGAIYSTGNDLLLWQKALKGNLLLNEENKHIYFTPGMGNYAFGNYVTRTKEGKTVIGHPGGINGFSSFMIRYVEDDIVVILLDNTAAGRRGSLDEISVGIYSTIENKPYAFPKKPVSIPLTETFLQQGVSGVIAKYQVLKSDTSYDRSKGERYLNDFGYDLLTRKRTKESLDILKFAVQEFPQSANTIDSYAEALLTDGQYKDAITQYERVLQLDPGNKNALAQIEKIKGLVK